MPNAIRPFLIGIPFYKNEHLVGPLVQSLIGCAAEIRDLHGEVILYDDAPEYQPLGAALSQAIELLSGAVPARLIRNSHNIGFVRTINKLISEGVERRSDVLLLNSDTMVFPGTLREMAEVASSDPMIGFVNPRSNNATLASLPFQDRFRHLEPRAAHAAWKEIAWRLPRLSYAPTAVGFCLLCRWKVLAEFGGFDEIYDAGYNEENDLIMRANRYGYRAVLANKAFVWHEGEASFSQLDKTRVLREAENRKILLARYPEYEGLTRNYFDGPEHRAERLLGTLIPDKKGRIDIAFDFSSFGDYQNGTFVAGRQLLAAAISSWPSHFNIVVICSHDAFAFHNYAALGVKRHDPNASDCYAAIFILGQPYDFRALRRSIERGAVVGFYMLDTISVDCGHLYSPGLYNIWQFALEHADLVATTSQLTADQFDRRFHYGAHVVRVRSMHSLDLKDYRSADATDERPSPLGEPFLSLAKGTPFLLVVGNKFPHKYVVETANVLAEAYPDLMIVAMISSNAAQSEVESDAPGSGASRRYAPQRLSNAPNIVVPPTGYLTDVEMERIYTDAYAVVFPTHYEGFGFPILNALAVKTPIFARRNEALEEVWRLQGENPNVHFFDLTAELVQLLSKKAVRWLETPDIPPPGGGALRSANDILEGLEKAFANVSYHRIVARIRGVQFAQDTANAEAAASVESSQTGRLAVALAYKLESVQRELELQKDALMELELLKEQNAVKEKSSGVRVLHWLREKTAFYPRLAQALMRAAQKTLGNRG